MTKLKRWVLGGLLASTVVFGIQPGFGEDDFEAWLNKVYLRTNLNHATKHAYVYVDQTSWHEGSADWQVRAIPRFICPYTVDPRFIKFDLPLTYAVYSVPWQGGVPTKVIEGKITACQKGEEQLPSSWR
ncbi:MAG: hypothetical protein HY347_06625 [candidate division NC10 bacterium]|nr:hypothetical protein [candidate division NC10 bacterium]